MAVVEWRGKELNLLTAAQGLPTPERVADATRVFELANRGATVYLADPFDLLANQLSVRRPKDDAHVEVPRSFVEQEIASEFRGSGRGRSRLAGARRLGDGLHLASGSYSGFVDSAARTRPSSGPTSATKVPTDARRPKYGGSASPATARRCAPAPTTIPNHVAELRQGIASISSRASCIEVFPVTRSPIHTSAVVLPVDRGFLGHQGSDEERARPDGRQSPAGELPARGRLRQP